MLAPLFYRMSVVSQYSAEGLHSVCDCQVLNRMSVLVEAFKSGLSGFSWAVVRSVSSGFPALSGSDSRYFDGLD